MTTPKAEPRARLFCALGVITNINAARTLGGVLFCVRTPLERIALLWCCPQASQRHKALENPPLRAITIVMGDVNLSPDMRQGTDNGKTL